MTTAGQSLTSLPEVQRLASIPGAADLLTRASAQPEHRPASRALAAASGDDPWLFGVALDATYAVANALGYTWTRDAFAQVRDAVQSLAGVSR